jgi:hypothetical protein
MRSMSARLQRRLRLQFPQETVEAYPLGGRQPGHRLVIVSKLFEGASPNARKERILNVIPDFIGTMVLRTPTEVKESILRSSEASPE